MYKAYKEAANNVKSMILKEKFAFSREPIKSAREVEFSPPKKIKSSDLERSMKRIIEYLDKTIVSIPKKSVKKVISLSDRIDHLRSILSNSQKIRFQDFIKSAKNRSRDCIEIFSSS